MCPRNSERFWCRFFSAIGKRYKLFWMGSKAKTDGIGIFVAEKWVDSVVDGN